MINLPGTLNLFAPPELMLLMVNYPHENETSMSKQGIIRSIMQIRDCPMEEAADILQSFAAQHMNSKEFYRLLQEWIGQRILVDKSPDYSMNPGVLKRAEMYFENARYIHLVRHPYGMIRSYEEAKMDLVTGSHFLSRFSLTRRQYAELLWTICHQNILRFLEQVPAERRHMVSFEDLVREPRPVVKGLCQFLGLTFQPDMLQPYKETRQRMTDGIHAPGMMMGDPKFFKHKTIQSSVADAWKKHYTRDFLGKETWKIAASFGYEPIRQFTYLPVEPAEKKEYYPLSSAQQRLYFLYQVEAEKIGYNAKKVAPIDKEAEKKTLEKVFRKIIHRHGIFRTSFEMVNNEPVQRVHQEVAFVIDTFEAQNREEANRMIREFGGIFDLSTAPILRVGLVKVGSETKLLVLEMHHIITDAHSQDLLMREFLTCYSGKEPEPLRFQYKDYVEWQNSRGQREQMKKQEKYWLDQFPGEIPVLDLPIDYARPMVQDFAGATVGFGLSDDEVRVLKEMAKESGATSFMVILTLYTILLSKLSGQEDIVVGTPIVGRRHLDLEHIMGVFVNTLAIRNYPVSSQTVYQYLPEVKKQTLAALENQEYPFEDLVDRVSVRRDTSRNPVFDAAFNLLNRDSDTAAALGINEEKPLHRQGTSRFDFTLTAVAMKDGFYFEIEYCTALFRDVTIERIIGYFKTLIGGLAANRGVKLADIDIAAENEKKKLLEDFNQTATDFPKERTMVELLEDQVEKYPDSVAVSGPMLNGKRGRFTYSRFNAGANALARVLRQKGVHTDAIVGMMVDRSLEMITGIFGILKAGGAYLPIVPGFPKERTRYMMVDSGAKLMLSQGTYEKEFTGQYQVIDLEDPGLYRGDTNNPVKLNDSSDLAYVIYTSGSTGKPKGTLTTHYNAIRVVRNSQYIQLTPGDRILQLSNYAFDGSVFDIYGALLNGAVLVLMKKEEVLAVDKLSAIIEKEKISVFFITTALFNTLVDINIQCFRHIRKVLFGGERVSVKHAKRALEYMGKNRIIHVYGPTETTVYASYYHIDRIDERAAAIPIGAPLSNTTAYIVDRNNRLVPIGVLGQLYIGGEGVARGYLNNPELTAEKFKRAVIRHSSLVNVSSDKLSPNDRSQKFHPNDQCPMTNDRSHQPHSTTPPLHHSPYSPIYQTGDLARWLADGNIEFLGRIDHQVKIRGYRVELGEIESQLLKYKGIQEAVVLAREKQNGGQYLCAYIVGIDTLSNNHLKEELSLCLPDFMIPSYFVRLDHLPLIANGKVDVKALPEPEVEVAAGYVAPRNEIEAELAAIWSEVLDIDKEKISIDSNFFDLGGNSINILIIHSRLQAFFGKEFPVVKLFTHSTIGTLASFLGSDKEEQESMEEAVVDRGEIFDSRRSRLSQRRQSR